RTLLRSSCGKAFKPLILLPDTLSADSLSGARNFPSFVRLVNAISSLAYGFRTECPDTLFFTRRTLSSPFRGSVRGRFEDYPEGKQTTQTRKLDPMLVSDQQLDEADAILREGFLESGDCQ